ncbi:MAG TPA: NAD(P)/FAD-dependent oxidoreductase [Candidatus Nanoarchaeia archaeon]|nr:NAD(P)/FAD-dependent oxidoreductase [Candidatus Nanoarchaeia archaeon]
MTLREQECFQNKLYDVAIIGAGPAGLMAANTFSSSVNFIILDPKKEIGLPLRCGEGVREKEFERLFGKRSYPFIRNHVHNHEVRYNSLKRSFKADYIQLDRPAFEKYLGKNFKGKLLLNTSCKDIIIKKDHALVITSKGTIKAKLVILAYGPNFRIQKKLKLQKKTPTLCINYGGIYKNHGFPTDRFYAYFFDKYFGYLWVFPKDKATANIGFCTIVKGINVKQVLEKALKDINPGLKQLSSYSGIFPCDGPIEKTYSNRLLVCGDAAGLVYAGTGEGIYYALESGRLAGLTAKNALKNNLFSKDFLKTYETAWKKSFGKQMTAGIAFRDLQYLAFRAKKMKELFKAPTNKELNMLLSGRIPLRARIPWYIYRIAKKLSS